MIKTGQKILYSFIIIYFYSLIIHIFFTDYRLFVFVCFANFLSIVLGFNLFHHLNSHCERLLK